MNSTIAQYADYISCVDLIDAEISHWADEALYAMSSSLAESVNDILAGIHSQPCNCPQCMGITEYILSLDRPWTRIE